MTVFLIFVSLLYALFTGILWLTWLRIPVFRPGVAPINLPFITVIIPVRNEAGTIENLLDDLSRQHYRHFEVIVADDASTDNTLSIVQAYLQTAPFALRPLPLAEVRSASPKKRAITQSIALATGQLIVTTDGDCRVGPDWLATIATFYEKTGAKLISGPVTFTDGNALSNHLQTVEFASLIGSGACTLNLGLPTMCNGANLCYEKQVFAEVGGFSGVDHLASGDDEFLMHKIAARYPGGVRFLKSPQAIVQTEAHQSWRAFYYQRKRWASKWRAYTSYWPPVLAVFVFLSNAAPIVAVAGVPMGFLNVNTALLVIGLKAAPEFLFLRQILVFLQKKKSANYILLTHVTLSLLRPVLRPGRAGKRIHLERAKT